jgi:hypothetical protein
VIQSGAEMYFELTVRQHDPVRPEESKIEVLRLDPVQPGETLEQTTEQMVTFLEQAVLQIQNTLETMRTKPKP